MEKRKGLVTPTQKKYLKLIQKGNVCSKQIPVPFRRSTDTVYFDVGGEETIMDFMVERMKEKGFVVDGDLYSTKYTSGPFSKWGRFLALTSLGKTIIGIVCTDEDSCGECDDCAVFCEYCGTWYDKEEPCIMH